MPIPIPIPFRRRCVPVITVCLGMLCAWPSSAAPAAKPSFVGELLAILVPLALIIVALLLVLRLARRRYGLTGQDAPLSILQILPVGPRERVVLVRTRSGRVFTIGVGAQSVTFITDISPDDLVAPEKPAVSSDPAHLHIHTAPSR